MNGSSVERSALEIVRNELERQGYTVILEPRGTTLPVELQGIQPDAIALRNEEKLVITVKVGRGSRTAPVDDNTHVILQANKAGWGHLLYFVNSPSDSEGPRLASKFQIAKSIEEIEQLRDRGHLSVALLASWATLEAIARATQPASFAKAQTPKRIVDVLARDGILTPDQGDFLRSMASVRNAFVHGDLLAVPEEKEVGRFLEILKSLATPLAAIEA